MSSRINANSQAGLLNPPHPSSSTGKSRWCNLHGCADSLALASLFSAELKVHVLVVPESSIALRLQHELEFFLENACPVRVFPDWETLPYDVFSPLPDIISQRLHTLESLTRLKHGVVIVTASTLMHRIAPREYILSNTFSWKTGEVLSLDSLRKQLDQVGYQYVGQVLQHGEFTVRGSILDLFPMGSRVPYRIEFFDDEIESIRTFDADSQRSIEKLSALDLFPAREFPLDDSAIRTFRQKFRSEFPDAEKRNPVYQDVSNGIAPGGVEYYLPLFLDKTETLFEYCPAGTTFVLAGAVLESADQFQQEAVNRYEQRRHDRHRPILEPAKLFLDTASLEQHLHKFPQLQLDSEADTARENNVVFGSRELPDLSFQPQDRVPTARLQSFVDSFSGKLLFVAESAGHREALQETLNASGIKPAPVSAWKEFLESGTSPCMIVAPMDHGLHCTDPQIAIITESQLSGTRAQQRRRRRRSSAKDLEYVITSLSELSEGSPVVHIEHGVGRYRGLQTLTVGEIETEFLILEYANDDKLYVPVSSLHTVGRFTGASPENAPLHKLGGEQWTRAKRKAAERVRDVAAELLDIHSRRASKTGFACSLARAEYERFVLDFPFEETPDQQTAIEQVRDDMLSARPMDRVICGDVGFGKTEVCMRAAFIAAHSGKQVAVLVPTTLLAQQHFQNFRDRFADWPIGVEVLSRFVSAKQQKQIISDVACGQVDILVGTHKLLQGSIEYKDLGLVVIDEEHRFGVRHKEHFKKLRSEVDVLTLTATPIPRTLNMAMSGLRDISIIATPPPNRHAINTFITEWTDSVIQEACLREIRRGGQIFFLHNNIKTIERTGEILKKLLPEARMEIAHGQMPEKELEQVMLDFYHQRFNLLLCTTIIESGIDIPSANTILLNRADKLGLAQLHQLRGRVGRSHHRAYAYLIVPPKKLMTRDAVKRLAAIEASDGLGAGFMLSSHDMEIRGAGELLGDEQSGQIHEIGFTLYTEMLERAVAALQSGEQPELETPLDNGPEIDLHFSTLIPDDYLPDVHTRLILYKRIANAGSNEELWDLKVEMIDRFGLLPEVTRNLFAVTGIKLQAITIGIRKIEASASGGRILFDEKPKLDPGRIIELIQDRPDIYRMDPPHAVRFRRSFSSAEEKLDFVQQLLDTLKTEPANESRPV